MTDYTQNVYFAPKDSLTAGDPSKKIKGSEIDAELAEIQTAIASKENVSAKGAANGYASLDANGDVPDAQIPTTVARLSSTNVFTVSQRIEGNDPQFWMVETDAPSDTKRWRLAVASNAMYFQTLNDAESVADTWMLASRSGNDVTSLQLNVPAIALNGAVTVSSTLVVSGATAVPSLTINGQVALTTGSGLNASNINAGSIGAAYVPVGAVTQHQSSLSLDASQIGSGQFANARISAGNVTQHQGSLSIAETQISDGSLLARVAAAETISGNWTVSGGWTITGSVTRSGEGRYVYLAGSGNTGGAITLSTGTASGTPNNGDIWIQHSA